MGRMQLFVVLALSVSVSTFALSAGEEHQHQHDPAHMNMPPASAAAGHDSRQAVRFPAMLREHTLENMRDHLLTLGRIQEALANGNFDEASDLAEHRLGMTSLPLHGAHDVAPFMPAGMQEAGTAMHHTASQLAVAIKDASVTADLKPVMASLARLNHTCVACHASYRLE
jgi:hypothetical protein